MSDPYEILGVTRDADEAEVRRCYLELVREFTPDRAPEKFATIRAAYDELRDPVRRLKSQLFETSDRDSIEALSGDLRVELRKRLGRLPLDELLALADIP